MSTWRMCLCLSTWKFLDVLEGPIVTEEAFSISLRGSSRRSARGPSKVEEDDGVGMKGKGGVGVWGSGEAGAPPTSQLRNHLTPTNFPILANLITAILDMLRPPGACLEHISVIHKIGALETH